MKRLVTISLIMLLLLAIEGVAIELLPSFIKLSQVYLTPHWLLLFLIIVVSFGYPNDSTIPITFAVVFGLMTDIPVFSVCICLCSPYLFTVVNC